MPNEIATPEDAAGPDQDLIQPAVEEADSTLEKDTLKMMLGADAHRGRRNRGCLPGDEQDYTVINPGEWRRQNRFGEVMPSAPKARRLSLETAIITRCRRRETGIEEALLALYYSRISMRQVEDIIGELWGTRVDLSAVSQLNRKIVDEIEAWRQQPILGEHAYVFLDSTWLTRAWDGEVSNVSALVAIGVNQHGYREVLGVAEGAPGDHTSWRKFLHELSARGLKGVKLVVGARHPGLLESLDEFFPGAACQRCAFSFYRDVWPLIPGSAMWPVAAMLKAIHASEDLFSARDKAAQVARRLQEMKLPAASAFVAQHVEETFGYYAFPTSHHRAVRSNSSLELIMRGIRRFARGVDAFPDNRSALLLVSARLRHIANRHWSAKRYLNMSRLNFPWDEPTRGRERTV